MQKRNFSPSQKLAERYVNMTAYTQCTFALLVIFAIPGYFVFKSKDPWLNLWLVVGFTVCKILSTLFVMGWKYYTKADVKFIQMETQKNIAKYQAKKSEDYRSA